MQFQGTLCFRISLVSDFGDFYGRNVFFKLRHRQRFLDSLLQPKGLKKCAKKAAKAFGAEHTFLCNKWH